jgi:multiple sugar transport system permease protein
VLVYPTFTIPFCTWLLMGFFKAMPREIEEAAIVDGCSLFGAFIKMAIPLSLPGILTTVIFTFTDLSIVFLMTNGGPVGATSVLGFAGFQTGIVSGDVSHGAAISLFMLPVLLVIVVVMLRFIRRREI